MKKPNAAGCGVGGWEMNLKAKPKKPSWQNRILRSGTLPANQFVLNPSNFRRHPGVQREAIGAILGEVGWVQNVIINNRTGNVIDGQLRIEEALSRDGDEPVPFVEVDLSVAEEKLVLAMLDPLSALATTDADAIDALVAEVETEAPALESILLSLQVEAEKLHLGAGKSDVRSGLKTSGSKLVKALFSVTELHLIEQAITATGNINRGAALTSICQQYLDEKRQFNL